MICFKKGINKAFFTYVTKDVKTLYKVEPIVLYHHHTYAPSVKSVCVAICVRLCMYVRTCDFAVLVGVNQLPKLNLQEKL